MSQNTIFISYAREDAKAAQRLFEDLRNVGLEPWLDEKSIKPGQPWRVAIRRAIKECRYFLALFSSSSVSRKGYVHKELTEALDILDMYPDSESYLIPLRLDECEPPRERVHDLHRVDLFPDWDAGFANLLRAFIEDDLLVRPTTTHTQDLAILVEKHFTARSNVEVLFTLKNVGQQKLVVHDLGLAELSARSVAIPCPHQLACRVHLEAALGRSNEQTECITLLDTNCFACYDEDTFGLGFREPATPEKFEELTQANPQINRDKLLFQSILSADAVVTLDPKESESFRLSLTAESGCTTVSTNFKLCAIYHDESGKEWVVVSPRSYSVQIGERAHIHASPAK